MPRQEQETHVDTTATLPVADSAEGVHESTNSFGEIRVELDGSTVVRNRFLDLAGVFDSVRQIRESDVLYEQAKSGPVLQGFFEHERSSQK
jgi:hypothetical protein